MKDDIRQASTEASDVATARRADPFEVWFASDPFCRDYAGAAYAAEVACRAYAAGRAQAADAPVGRPAWLDALTRSCDLARLGYVERPPMTLNEIVAAVRTNELVTGHDMRYAIVAFDVLMSELHVDRNVEQLAVFFKAAESVPREYAGHANDPENAEAVEWYRAMRGVSGK